MRLDAFLLLLNGVQRRGARWIACCPGHTDKHPSLQITEGDKALLLKCWSGCPLATICENLVIEPRDLFYDSLESDPQQRRAAARKREHERYIRDRHADQRGKLIDALREADYFVRSRQGIEIRGWNDQQLDAELNTLADAYALLEKENLDGHFG